VQTINRPDFARFLLATSLSLIVASVASADEITVDGTVVRGEITSLSAAGIVIEPEFGAGSVTIAFDDIETVQTERRFLLLIGETGEASGRLRDVRDGRVWIGDDEADAQEIDPAEIFSGSPLNGSVSRWDRLKSRWRYWDGALDAGFTYIDGTTDTTNAAVGLGGERTKPGTRLVLRSAYRFGAEKQRDSPSSTLNNELRGLAKGEYDLTERLLVVTSFDAEYDEVERLSVRAVPKLGLGYRLYKTPTAFFQVESAPAYIYERFFGGITNDFFGVSFGAETGVKLPYDAQLAGRVDYLPSVREWVEDYLIRSEVSLTMPLAGRLNARFAVVDQYDNSPSPGVDRNELQMILGLLVRL